MRSPRGLPYLLGQALGGGAFGGVFAAIGPFDQQYAVKVFRPTGEGYEELKQRWLKEAERLYRLRHPHIVYVHDFFEVNGWFYLVMERCDHTLRDMLIQPFTDRLVVEVSRQLLFAIQYLSDNQLVHNDLHAGNVLAKNTDPLTVKIGDLGIAQDLYPGQPVRPELVQHAIMAPEVAVGGFSSTQSDLYQLGLLMYHMHTGRPAIDPNSSYDAMVEQIRRGVPRALAESLGSPIGNIISVLLRRHEQYRYTSPLEVWEDLRKLNVWS